MDGRRRGQGGSRQHAACPPCPPGLWLVKAPSVSSRDGNRCCCSHLPLLPKQLCRVASLRHGAHLHLLRPALRAPGLPLQRDAHKRCVRWGTPRSLAKPRASSCSCSSSSPVCPKSACQHFTRRGESPNKGPAQELMASPLLGWVGECQGWVLAAPPVPGNVVWVGGAGSRVRFLIRGAAGTDTNWNQSQGPGSRCAHSALAAMAWTKLICAGGNAMSRPRQDAIGGLGGSIRPAHVSPSFFTFFPICKQPQLPQRAQH